MAKYYDLVGAIKELTDNYTKGSDFILLLEVKACSTTTENVVKFLLRYGIKGERLETFYRTCGSDYELAMETLWFLNYEYLSKKEVLNNLDKKENAVPIITEAFDFDADDFSDDYYFEKAAADFRKRSGIIKR